MQRENINYIQPCMLGQCRMLQGTTVSTVQGTSENAGSDIHSRYIVYILELHSLGHSGLRKLQHLNNQNIN